MITAEQARAVAGRALDQLAVDTGRPLAIWDGEFGVAPIEDYGDVWIVNWNSVEYLESGDFFKQILTGPIVVPKDGGEYFVLGTYGTVREMLADRARQLDNEQSD